MVNYIERENTLYNKKNTLYNKSDARIRVGLYNVDIRIREY